MKSFCYCYCWYCCYGRTELLKLWTWVWCWRWWWYLPPPTPPSSLKQVRPIATNERNTRNFSVGTYNSKRKVKAAFFIISIQCVVVLVCTPPLVKTRNMSTRIVCKNGCNMTSLRACKISVKEPSTNFPAKLRCNQ